MSTVKEVLIVIVNGKKTEVEANVNASLHSVIAKALAQTSNVGQPPENWELKDEAGNVLDPNKKVGDYTISNKTLFLNLKTAAGGGTWKRS